MAEPIKKTGILYVVATPIGNLEDITLRALRILGEVKLIAAEDTRHTRKLLSHFNIHTPLISYYKEREMSRAAEIVSRLQNGDDVALVSDAGTPGISDPGAILVQAALAAGLKVCPVVGASALTGALSVSGLTESSFVFLGFLPSKQGDRRKLLQGWAGQATPLVFYESPKRIKKTLADCLDVLGDRKAFVAREVTKIHEEFLSKNLSEIWSDIDSRDQVKGEFVVMIAGAQINNDKPDIKDLAELLVWYRDQSELSMSAAVKTITRDLNLSKSEVYRMALDIWEGKKD